MRKRRMTGMKVVRGTRGMSHMRRENPSTKPPLPLLKPAPPKPEWHAKPHANRRLADGARAKPRRLRRARSKRGAQHGTRNFRRHRFNERPPSTRAVRGRLAARVREPRPRPDGRHVAGVGETP